MKNITTKLMETTGRSQQECEIINEILNSRFIIGHNKKEKFIADFVEKLNITSEEADELYNQCAEVIVKGVFRK